MNLPNALTVGRIVVDAARSRCCRSFDSWPLRLVAFVLFLVAAITDYFDGHLARSRKEETDLGQLLDPLADKLLLVGTFVPMYLLAQDAAVPDAARRRSGLPLWIVARRARPRSVHDALPPGGEAARRRDRRDRPGEMEDGVSSSSGRARAYFWFLAVDARRERNGWDDDALARVRAVQRHRRHGRRWSSPSSSRSIRSCVYLRSFGSVFATSPIRSDVAATDRDGTTRSKSSPSATSCSSASRSTPTPRTSRASSRRSACTSCGAPPSATRRRRSRAPSREALDRTGAVITTGGLGPTSDDLTKPSIAELFGREMDARRRASRVDGGALAQALQPPAAGDESQAGDDPRRRDEARRTITARRPASGSRTTAAAGSRCCPAFRARCAACSPTRCCRGSRRASRRARSFARARCARPASPSRCSPTRSNRWTAARSASTLAYLPSIAGVDLRLTVRDVAGRRRRTALLDARRRGCASASARRSTARTTTTSRPSCSSCVASAGSRSASPRAAPAACSARGSRRFRARATSCSAASSPTHNDVKREPARCRAMHRSRSTAR